MANIEETLVRKLHPARFPDMSGLMAAIVGCILDRQFTEPSIAGVGPHLRWLCAGLARRRYRLQRFHRRALRSGAQLEATA